MNFLISDAWAETAPAAQQQGGMSTLILMVGMFVVFYFLLIRPQQKRAKEHRAMVSALSKGDEVLTAGGIIGRVSDINDSYLTVEISDGVHIKIQRPAVQAVLPKGTLKSA